MKSSKMSVGLLVAVFAMLANSALAHGSPVPVPDSASTMLLISMSVLGLSFCRKLFR